MTQRTVFALALSLTLGLGLLAAPHARACGPETEESRAEDAVWAAIQRAGATQAVERVRIALSSPSRGFATVKIKGRERLVRLPLVNQQGAWRVARAR